MQDRLHGLLLPDQAAERVYIGSGSERWAAAHPEGPTLDGVVPHGHRVRGRNQQQSR
jgi:hypothetical protein